MLLETTIQDCKVEVNQIPFTVNTAPYPYPERTITLADNAGSASSENDNPKVEVRGNDVAGIIILNTGRNPNPQGILTFRFTRDFYSQDNLIVNIIPLSWTSAEIKAYPSAIGSNGFEIAARGALLENEQYIWGYNIIQVLPS